MYKVHKRLSLILLVGFIFINSIKAQPFIPSDEPVASSESVKPLIHVILDDSGSMGSNITGTKIIRSRALGEAIDIILNRYKQKAYLGISFINYSDSKVGSFQMPLKDYAHYTGDEYQKIITPLIHYVSTPPPGHQMTGVAAQIYQTLKMWRGLPIIWKSGRGYSNIMTYPPTNPPEFPVKYRCQSNHMILMTDGFPNNAYDKGFLVSDFPNLPTGGYAQDDIGFIHERQTNMPYSIYGYDYLARLAWNMDLRDWAKRQSDFDSAGKEWFDKDSKKMNISIHTVSLDVDPEALFYRQLTTPSNGMRTGFKPGEGSTEALTQSFDQLFRTIVLEKSTAVSTNDRINTDILDKVPSDSTDLSEIGTIRYDSVFNFSQQTGVVRANVPYIESKPNSNENSNIKAEIKISNLWDSDHTIKQGQGEVLTLNDNNKVMALTTKESEANAIIADLQKVNEEFNEHHLDWLVNFQKSSFGGNLRTRMTPIGSITDSDLILFNKDILHINLELMSNQLKQEMTRYLLYRANNQPSNLIIVGDNDGMIHFINASRGIKQGSNRKAGERVTAYFPRLFTKEIEDIAGSDTLPKIRLGGKLGIVDGIVTTASTENFVTLGNMGLGSGGKGIVGFQLFRTSNDAAVKAGYSQEFGVIPLYEITNETKGFENLGYTYSDFSYYIRTEPKQYDSDKQKRGVVSMFGNGFGTDKSSVFLVDAFTGKKIDEIMLNPNGGGAGSVAAIIKPYNNSQRVDRIYVGDYSGYLYKVVFEYSDDHSYTTKVDTLFEAKNSSNFGQSAISIKPLVIIDKDSSKTWLYFGTGLAKSSIYDRGVNSLVTHSIYALKDNNTGRTLRPSDLALGSVSYKAGEAPSDYLMKSTYNLKITPPSGNIANGWYVKLDADRPKLVKGSGTGERVVISPQYNANNNSVIFQTWGVDETNNERALPTVRQLIPDPCLTDALFGKVLSFDAFTGKASKNSEDSDILNVGMIGSTPGNILGDNISNDFFENSKTSLANLSKELVNQLKSILGEADSSYTTDRDNSGSLSYTNDQGEIIYEEDNSGRLKIKGTPRRISINRII